MFGRSKKHADGGQGRFSNDTERTAVEQEKGLGDGPSKQQLKRATRTRKVFSLLTSFLLLISVVFVILVEVGNTSKSSSIRNKIYFIKLNLTNIIPESVPNSLLVNSIARTLGLHDFYQVGLWNFCEGYNDEGVTNCSTPETLYWFNPVQIILNELLAGATSMYYLGSHLQSTFTDAIIVSLPAEVTNILNLIRLVSHWMFGLYLAGACLAFVMIFVAPMAIFSRWLALLTSIFTFLAALFITVASVIATVMFIIMRNAFTSVDELNIGAAIGLPMFVFMWIASGTAIVATLIQVGECCCCASRRDIKTGRKKGSKKAWIINGRETGQTDGKAKRGWFGRRK